MSNPAPGGDAMTAAQHSPLVLYTLIAVLVVSGLAQAVPQVQKILGPLGKMLGGRAEEAKRAAIEADSQVDKWRDDKIAELERWKEHREALDREHYAWDVVTYAALRQAAAALKSNGITVEGLDEIPPPPPLN